MVLLVTIFVQTCFSWMWYDPVWFTFTFLGNQQSSLFLMWWTEKGKGLTFWKCHESVLSPERKSPLSRYSSQPFWVGHLCRSKPVFLPGHLKLKSFTGSSQNGLTDHVMKTFFSENNQFRSWVSGNWLRKLLWSIFFWEATNSSGYISSDINANLNSSFSSTKGPAGKTKDKKRKPSWLRDKPVRPSLVKAVQPWWCFRSSWGPVLQSIEATLGKALKARVTERMFWKNLSKFPISGCQDPLRLTI